MVDKVSNIVLTAEEAVVFVKLNALEGSLDVAKNPKVKEALQKKIDELSDCFSKIIQSRYHISADGLVENLSPIPVDTFKAQLASLQQQADALEGEIGSLQGQLIAKGNDPTSVDDAASVNVLITQFNGSIETDKVASAQSQQSINQIGGYIDSANVFHPGSLLLNKDVLSSSWQSATSEDVSRLAQAKAEITRLCSEEAFRTKGPPTASEINNLSNILRSSTEPTYLPSLPLYAQVKDLKFALSNRDGLQTRIVQTQSQLTVATTLVKKFSDLTVVEQQEATVQTKLTAAEKVLADAKSQFDKLTRLEKTLFQEFYPDTDFPAFTPIPSC